MAKGKKKGNKRAGGADQDGASAEGASEGGKRLTKREQRMMERESAYSEATSQTDAAASQPGDAGESGAAPTKGSKKKRQKQAAKAAAAAAAAAAAEAGDASEADLADDLDKLDIEESADGEDADAAGVDDVVVEPAGDEEPELVEEETEVVPEPMAIAPPAAKKSMFQMLDSDSDSDQSDNSDNEEPKEEEKAEVVVDAAMADEPAADAIADADVEQDAAVEQADDNGAQSDEDSGAGAGAGVEKKKEKKKKSKRDKAGKKEKKEKKEKKSKKKKSKKSSSVDGDSDDDDNEDNDDDDDAEGAGAGEAAADDGEKKTKKKKLSNKERRALRDQEAGARETAQLAAVSKANAKSTQFAVSMTAVREDENWANSTDIYIPDFTVSAYGKTLFENAELKITHGRRYGLVGPNGMGKTTVLKQLANGELRIPPKIDVLYVEQEVKADDTTAVDMVMQADEKRTALLKRENEILEMMDNGEYTDELQAELNVVTNDLKAAGSDTAEARALGILHGLGFTLEMQTAPTKSFSGGWRMRVSIARALFMQPTLLLLDEPTNHLDLNAVIWLDDYLQKWKSTLLVVSHDQEFLDSVCTDIIHLHNRQLYYYRGNYELFKEQFEKTKIQEERAYEKQQKALKQAKKSGLSAAKASEKEKRRAARGQEAGGKKGKKGGETASSADTSTKLLSRPKDYTVQFDFPVSRVEISPPFLQVNEVSFGYPGGPRLFNNVTFGLDMDSRITIVGPNGVGKSTLLHLITQEIEASMGEVTINRRLKIARYHQHFLDVLPMNLSPTEFLVNTYQAIHDKIDPENGGKKRKNFYQEVRDRLGRFGLPGEAHEIKMVNLSGGQKSRVVFASISFQMPHMIVLDEPTNNLDIESIDALSDAINEFEGGVILVSHDARLITTTDMVLWLCDKQTVFEVEGGFEAYRDEILTDLQKRDVEERERQEARALTRAAQRQARVDAIKERAKAKAIAAAGGAASSATATAE